MKNVQIYPSLLALKDHPETWNQRIDELSVPIDGIHYDIGDSEFVPSKMLNPADISILSERSEDSVFPVDVHLMVRRPSEYFPQILDFACVDAVAFHVECGEDIHETIQTLRNAGKRVGLAILHTTPADHLDPYLLEIDYVIVMTVTWGFAGTPFIPEMLPKITEIRNKAPELPIIVDGGINAETLPLCIQAGSSWAVMSWALFSWKDTSWLL